MFVSGFDICLEDGVVDFIDIVDDSGEVHVVEAFTQDVHPTFFYVHLGKMVDKGDLAVAILKQNDCIITSCNRLNEYIDENKDSILEFELSKEQINSVNQMLVQHLIPEIFKQFEITN